MKLVPQKLQGWGYNMVKIAIQTSAVLTNPPVWRTGR